MTIKYHSERGNGDAKKEVYGCGEIGNGDAKTEVYGCGERGHG